MKKLNLQNEQQLKKQNSIKEISSSEVSEELFHKMISTILALGENKENLTQAQDRIYSIISNSEYAVSSGLDKLLKQEKEIQEKCLYEIDRHKKEYLKQLKNISYKELCLLEKSFLEELEHSTLLLDEYMVLCAEIRSREEESDDK